MITDQERKLLDYSINHQVDLSRFSTGQVRDVLSLLNAADKDIVTKLQSYYSDDGRFTPARLNALLTDVRGTLAEAYKTAGGQFADNMRAFAIQEGDDTANMLSGTIPSGVPNLSITSVSDNQLKALVDRTPTQYGADGAYLLEETFAKLAAGKEDRIRGAVRLGMIQGETTSELVRRIQGSRASQYKDGIFEKYRKNAETIVRTEVNAISNRAAQATFHANDSVVKGWTFHSTLDGRTSLTCASLSGTTWGLDDEKAPFPPRHPNCRSFAVPVVKTWKELGFGDRFKEMDPGVRSSKDGTVAGDITFDKWLRGQPEGVQVQILGVTRQKLFAAGKLPLDRFTDASGRIFTLDDLKKQNKATFKRLFDKTDPAPVVKADKPVKIKPEPKAIEPDPPKAKEYPKAATIAEAKTIIASLLDQSDPASSSYQYGIKYKHRKGETEGIGRNATLINGAHFVGLKSIDQANAIIKGLSDAGSEADRLGIPRIRRANGQTGYSFGGAMGDGSLSIKINYTDYNADRLKAGKPQFSYQYGEDIAKHTEWVIWHEFGHHIHQQTGRVFARQAPLEDEFRAFHLAESRAGYRFQHPTTYSANSSEEYFAENYAIIKMGKQELADPKVLEWMKKKGIV